jgi:hypothetical protein
LIERCAGVSYLAVEAWDAFDIVGEDPQWQVFEEFGEGIEVTIQVRTEQLEADLWAPLVNRFYAGSVMGGTTIGQIVAIDHRDDDMGQAHAVDRLGQFGGLLGIQGWWNFLRADGTEPAATGADFTRDHESRSSSAPAIVDIRAAGLFADGVQAVLADIRFGLVESDLGNTCWKAGSEPVRQSLAMTFTALLNTHSSSAATATG